MGRSYDLVLNCIGIGISLDWASMDGYRHIGMSLEYEFGRKELVCYWFTTIDRLGIKRRYGGCTTGIELRRFMNLEVVSYTSCKEIDRNTHLYVP
jgi:hypothetical protein